MGFSVCSPHKMTNEWREPYRMIPDDKETERKLINGKWLYVEVKKVHPKWQKFYNLKFDETLTIWIKTIRNEYPYLDTFTRYDSKKGILYNDQDRDLGGYILRSTSGEYRDSIPQRKAFFNRIINFFKTN